MVDHQQTTTGGAFGDPAYVRALSHPLRVRILAVLEERTASPLELSRLLRADIGVVAYHVRTLHRLGMIDLERETKVRGAAQRHYRARERPLVSGDDWTQTAPADKQAMVDARCCRCRCARRSNAAAGSTARTPTSRGRR